jgi:exonuclease V gamma subunit
MPDIIEKVAKMRELQKNFFKYRDSLTLRACKAAEREVDQELETLTKKKQQNPTLF